MMDIPFDEQQQHSNPKCHDATVAAIHFMLWMFQTGFYSRLVTARAVTRSIPWAPFSDTSHFHVFGRVLGQIVFFVALTDPCDW
jgi:hypothetical protein